MFFNKYRKHPDYMLLTLYETLKQTPEVEKDEKAVIRELKRRGYKLKPNGVWVKE
jgi:hypothetical protein